MANQVMRITLKAYDHQLVDASAKKIIETVKKNGAQVSGQVQRLQRTVRAPHTQETDRYHCTHTQDR